MSNAAKKLTGIASGFLGGGAKSIENGDKNPDGAKKLTDIASGFLGGGAKSDDPGSGFRAGDLIRPDKVVNEAKNALYAVKPDVVDWIDWQLYPFHSIKFKNDVTRILERKKYDVNALNEEKVTALHVMAAKEDKELLISILSAGAELEIQDGDGNTPLHVAAGKNSVSVTQALLGFWAEVNARNNNGDTPRHLAAVSEAKKKDRILYVLHAVGAERCESGKAGCNDGCSYEGNHNGTPPPVPLADQVRSIIDFYPEAELRKESNKGGRVLCLDGGGIKGVVLIGQLMALEKLTERQPLDCFDWIAGTSTGGILASALAAGKPLRELLNVYFLIKDRVFGLTRPFSDKELVVILKDILGPDTVMSDLQTCKLLITGTLCDKSPVKLHLFRNYPAPSTLVAPDAAPSDRDPPLADHAGQVIWHAARSSGAAPTYFEPEREPSKVAGQKESFWERKFPKYKEINDQIEVEVKKLRHFVMNHYAKFDRYMDGGLVANNPTLDTLTEIHERNLALKRTGQEDQITDLSVVVSLGCGMAPVEDLDVDIVWPDDPLEFANNVLGIVKILNILSNQTTNPDNSVVDRARAWCSMINVPYYRFSPTLHQNVDLATKDDKVLSTVIWETRAYMYQHYEQAKACARHLV